MELNQIYLLILTTVIGGIVGFLVSWFMGTVKKKAADKVQENKEEKETKEAEHRALMEACKEMLRGTLKEDLEFYKKQGYCSVEDKADIENVYKLYHSYPMNGNGRGTRYYEGIMSLPDEPHIKIEDTE
jgi:uncharacterized membrane protein YgaE (UPF0421/DUF939 family)